MKFINENVEYEIYSLREDDKIYFHNVENKSLEYNSNLKEMLENIKKGIWKLSDDVIIKELIKKEKDTSKQKLILKENINQNLNNMSTKDTGNVDPKELDVKDPKNAMDKKIIVLEVGDPVLLKRGDLSYVGIIAEAKKENGIADDNEITINVKNFRDIESMKATRGELEPLFLVKEDNSQKIWLQFSYKEVQRALKNTTDVDVKLEGKHFTPLMLGNKSEIIPVEKEIDGKKVNVEARVELRRDKNGEPSIHHQVKLNELDLSRPIYGLELTDVQKKQLETTGELGLVSGFKSGDKDFKLWVSLDKELNSVVTKRENDVYINKVYGVELKEEQKNDLKSGKGILVELNNNKKLFVQVSAASLKSDGIKVYSEEKAKEFKLIPEEKKNESKKKSSGLKM